MFGFLKKIGKAVGSVAHVATSAVSSSVNFTSGLVGHIPVVGKPFHAAIDATIAGPILTANKITAGARLDHAVLDGIKKQAAGIKDVAPYAKMIISKVPGIGPTADAAIGAGLSLVQGKSITKDVLGAVRGQLPAEAQKIFDQGVNLASTATSDNRPAIQAQLNQLTGSAQKALQVGLAMGNGLRLQTALQKAAASPAANLAMQIAGTAKAASNPVLDAALQVITDPDVKNGFQVALGTFTHDTPPAAITALRTALNAKGRQGFDLALATYIGMNKKSAPDSMPPREKFGYYTIHGIAGATPDQRLSTLSNVAHDNSVRTGGDVAAKELNGNWFHHLMLKLHVVKAA